MWLLAGLLVALSAAGIRSADSSESFSDVREMNAVKDLVKQSYLHGAFNELNPDAMATGFHEDFAIFSAKGSELSRYEIADWVAGVRKRKADPEFDPEKNKWSYEFANVDVTEDAAQVKVQLSRDGKLIYTDYLSLLKFEDEGWRIVAKVYHRH
ncbi:MAG TPA: hypothetical protein DCE41_19120 [Cytophagales bacterium]|nr:hypothetical protein [Cytophagales bacterium]HAA19675.1 hypothetical protein [Cytophagales bacterium]HAP62699.1 hypothetical protein [Cytophagales bacterium]